MPLLRAYLRLVTLGLACGALLPPVAVVFTRIQTRSPLLEGRFLFGLAVGLSVWGGACVMLLVASKRLRMRLDETGVKQAVFIDGLTGPWADLAIVGAAAASLVLELAVIRWQGTVFPVFAFYKDLGLLACFVGLGTGYALGERRHIPSLLAIPLVAAQIGLLVFLRHTGEGMRARSVLPTAVSEQLNMFLPTASGFSSLVPIYFFLACVFLLTALAFVPIGQVCGRTMARRTNLRAYGLNLLGSLLGVLAMQGLSAWWTPPIVWFGAAFLGLLVFQTFSAKTFLLAVLSGAAGLAALATPVTDGTERTYSPYQLVERRGEGHWMTICASGLHYQTALDLSDENMAWRKDDPYATAVKAYYELPYRLFAAKRGRPERVAIAGAGSGNDAAGALRMDVRHVDAIEMDPAIVAMGKQYHPEAPYNDPRVACVVNDARSHFRQTPHRYDLVAYGFLDSHAALSHGSGVRVDSFVYTVEGIREARACLKPGGLMSLAFNVIAPELGQKIFAMMREAFDGQAPLCVRRTDAHDAVMFIQGDGWDRDELRVLAEKTGFEDCTATYTDSGMAVDLPTDDWPFFYMPRRVYPLSYVGMVALMATLAVGLVVSLLGRSPSDGSGKAFRRNPAPENAAFFFPGRRVHAGRNERNHRTGTCLRQYVASDRRGNCRGTGNGLRSQLHRGRPPYRADPMGLYRSSDERYRRLLDRQERRFRFRYARARAQRLGSDLPDALFGNRVLDAVSLDRKHAKRHGREPVGRHVRRGCSNTTRCTSAISSCMYWPRPCTWRRWCRKCIRGDA